MERYNQYKNRVLGLFGTIYGGNILTTANYYETCKSSFLINRHMNIDWKYLNDYYSYYKTDKYSFEIVWIWRNKPRMKLISRKKNKNAEETFLISYRDIEKNVFGHVNVI